LTKILDGETVHDHHNLRLSSWGTCFTAIIWQLPNQWLQGLHGAWLNSSAAAGGDLKWLRVMLSDSL